MAKKCLSSKYSVDAGANPARCEELMKKPLWQYADTIFMTNLSETTIRHGVKAGTFPQPVKLSPRRCAFKRDEVLAWIKSLAYVPMNKQGAI